MIQTWGRFSASPRQISVVFVLIVVFCLVASVASFAVTPQPSAWLDAVFALCALGSLTGLVVLVITPALRFADYAGSVGGADVLTPRLPQLWQPSMVRLAQALAGQRRTSLQAKEAETMLSALLDVALDALVISEGDGRIVVFNPAAERLFGCTAADAAGKNMSDLIAVPVGERAAGASSPPAYEGNILEMLDRRMTLDGVRADASTFPAEIAIHRVAPGGRILYAAQFRDLTADREAAQAFERQRQSLREIERFTTMGSLLGSVAHELNNPLAILVAQATLLREKAPTADVERRAERIHSAAQRAGRIVKSFTAMAQQKTPVREALNLNEVLDATFDLIVTSLRKAGIAVERHLAPALPNVHADRDLMGQVFATLIIGAKRALLDFPEPRSLVLTSRVEGDDVIVEIEHNGLRLLPTAAERFFDPNSADPNSAVNISEATLAMGLSTSRMLVEAQAGSISLIDRPEAGALFRVVMPADRSAVPASAQMRRSEASGLTILVIDDERDVAEALAELIELFGHRTSVETSPTDALHRIESEAFDMIFVDYRMPGLDGLSLRQRIGEIDEALAARTVLMTGDSAVTVGENADPEESGTLTLEKPFAAVAVRALLDRVERDRIPAKSG